MEGDATGEVTIVIHGREASGWGLEASISDTLVGALDFFGLTFDPDGDQLARQRPGRWARQWSRDGRRLRRSSGRCWCMGSDPGADPCRNGVLDHGRKSLGVDGDLAVLGSRATNPSAGGGSIAVYRFVAGQWLEQPEPIPPRPSFNPGFGEGVAVAGDRVVAAAPSHGNFGFESVGEVYSFSFREKQGLGGGACRRSTCSPPPISRSRPRSRSFSAGCPGPRARSESTCSPKRSSWTPWCRTCLALPIVGEISKLVWS